MVVQYILASRKVTRPVKKEKPAEEKPDEKKEPKEEEGEEEVEEAAKASDTPVEDEKKTNEAAEDEKDKVPKPEAEEDPDTEEIEEYYVKYRNFSYLHCEWRTEDELLKGDRRIPAKLKRFKQKQANQTNIFENVSYLLSGKILVVGRYSTHEEVELKMCGFTQFQVEW